MHSPPEERPDALVIADDNIVEPVTRGLLAAGLSTPKDLDIVAHCNLPNPPQAAVPVRFLGYDCRQMLSRCIELVDAQRATMCQGAAGEAMPSTTVPAVFADEAEAAADGPVEAVGQIEDHQVVG